MFSVNDFLKRVRSKASIPNSDKRFNDEYLLDLAEEGIFLELYPIIMTTREQYFLDYKDMEPDSNNRILIPNRAYNNKLYSLQHLNGDNVCNIPLLDDDDLENSYNPYGFKFIGRYIQFYSDSIDKVKLSYYRKHNKLVTVDNTTVVLSLSGTSITVGDGSLFEVGDKICNVDPNSGVVLNDEVLITGISGNELFLDVENINISDRISIQDTTTYFSLPDSYVYLLVNLVASKIYSELGDTENYQISMNEYNTSIAKLQQVTEDRVASKPKIIRRKTHRINWR
jgi:hypothetical protein